ncbi:protease inhibitor Inh/omp19 family protein [Roseixanthobacter glucoisosaccharinicivorans]|uniref:protease inhibitor Inh/omp19 family protein n=1 Tax=Roseixanthobacter glucoisosaccharinicivorans TaxID=3119923 RepID=UPI00372C09F6
MRRLRLVCAVALIAPVLAQTPVLAPTSARAQAPDGAAGPAPSEALSDRQAPPDQIAQAGGSGSTPPKPAARPAKPPAAGKSEGAKSETTKVDPALRAQAEQAAGAFVLSSADDQRKCALTLRTEPVANGFALAFDAGACAGIGFMQQVVAWTPDSSGAVRLLNAQGRLVVEFGQATAGNYEALREGDGVYFLASPAASEDATGVRVEEMLGDWDLARVAGTPICHVVLLEEATGNGAHKLQLGTPCDSAITQFGPVSWSIEGGNVLMASSSGGPPLRFARQEDGGWAKVPERGRPLLLLRQ